MAEGVVRRALGWEWNGGEGGGGFPAVIHLYCKLMHLFCRLCFYARVCEWRG